MASLQEFLPVDWDSATSSYKWSNGLLGALQRLSQGPSVSAVRDGSTLADFHSQVAHPDSHPDAADGLCFFFENQELDNTLFFDATLPKMADLALRLPQLLAQEIELTVKTAEELKNSHDRSDLLPPSPLQILHPQQPGLVLITQELAASLLACAFYCLFPVLNRHEHRLPAINMDTLFARVWDRSSQVHKIHCIIHYFHRVCEAMPQGTISYERKVLNTTTMDHAFWINSTTPLCSFETLDEGIIEDAGWEYAQVDFANKFLGGGVLRLGCVQEEIRFMLSPELIVGMLFMPAMAENETIEITGSERFSNYAGYGSTFRYVGDYVDSNVRDHWGRRCTKIIAMDAKARPGEAQFQQKLLLREICKAYCGFLSADNDDETPEPASEMRKYKGIATGNWGCGAFGGNLPIKSMLQWLAASEAKWPTTLKYFTFGDPRAERLREAVHFISENYHDVGHVWSTLVKYGELRRHQNVQSDFFTWLLENPTLDHTLSLPT